MNRIKSLIKRSSNIHSLIGNIMYAAFSMTLFMLMVRILDKELYGRWAIFITAISLLDMLRLGLTGTGAIRAISSSSGEDQKRNIAASYQLSLFTTVAISCIFVPVYFLIHNSFTDSYYLPVLIFYPFLAFANLAHMQATTYSQGVVNFKRVLIIRSLVGLFNLLFISLYILFVGKDFTGVVIAYGVSDIVVSILVIIKKWDGLEFIKKFHKPSILNIFHFGKYSAATYIGSNLLRGSDTIIISLSSVLGAQAVAVYVIPIKFLELVEIPLRSFTATAFPKLSSAFTESKEKFNKMLTMYLSYSVLLLLPILIFLPIFSTLILQFLGGGRYTDSLELQKSILYIFTIYIIALPHDRYSGIALLAFNESKLNFYKVVFMLICNIIFDCIAVFVFHSLVFVAVASVIFTFVGIFVGWYHINKFTGLKVKDTFIGVYQTCIYLYNSILRKKKLKIIN